MHPKKALAINIVIFSIILIVHFFRSVLEWPARISNLDVPLWFSYLAVILLIIVVYLNYQAFKKVKQKYK